MLTRTLSHPRKPGTDIRSINLTYKRNSTFLLKVCFHQSESDPMPFHRFRAVITTLMILQVVIDGLLHCCFRATVCKKALLFLLCTGFLWRPGAAYCLLPPGLHLSIKLGTLCKCPGLRHIRSLLRLRRHFLSRTR